MILNFISKRFKFENLKPQKKKKLAILEKQTPLLYVVSCLNFGHLTILYVPCSKSATNTTRKHKTPIFFFFFFHACQKGDLYYGCLHWTLCLPVILLAYCCYFQTCHALAISRLYKTHARLSKEKKKRKVSVIIINWWNNSTPGLQIIIKTNRMEEGGRWICTPHITDRHTHTHTHILWAQYWAFMHIVLHASVVECILRYIRFQCCNVSY
jgi:hypothetical protein